MGKLLAVLIGGAIGLAIGGMVAMGLNLGIVYLYMWLMNGVLHIPYVPASSTLFAMFSFGAILLSVIYLFLGPVTKGDRKSVV